MKIYASKNYPTLSYMVSNQDILYKILSTQTIATSPDETNKNSNQRHVCLSRDLTSAAKRNSTRWKYGILLDGSKLTDRYKISPYSYANVEFNSSRKSLVVKTLTLYDTGECTLTLLNHPTKQIPKRLYDEIREMIITDSQGLNDVKHLVVSTGTRRVNGRMIVEKFLYNVPTGGIRLSSKTLSESGQMLLTKHTNLNETEERLYTESYIIDISGCIDGIIIPNGADVYDTILDLCDEHNWSVLTY